MLRDIAEVSILVVGSIVVTMPVVAMLSSETLLGIISAIVWASAEAAVIYIRYALI